MTTETTGEKGVFIVLDGNDGSGKATQADLLAAALERRSIPSLKIDFPGYERNLFGGLLAGCLAGKHGDFVGLDPHIASLVYAADRFKSSDLIRDALREGKVVIADRFASSNQIHQGGKIADEADRIAFLTWLEQMEHGAFGIPRPDRILYLRVPLEISLDLLAEKRLAKNGHLGDGEKDQAESDRQYLQRSHETAGWLASREPSWRIIDCESEVGGMRSREDIHAEILGAIEDIL